VTAALIRRGDPRYHFSIYCKYVGVANLEQFTVSLPRGERCRTEKCLTTSSYDWREVPQSWMEEHEL